MTEIQSEAEIRARLARQAEYVAGDGPATSFYRSDAHIWTRAPELGDRRPDVAAELAVVAGKLAVAEAERVILEAQRDDYTE